VGRIVRRALDGILLLDKPLGLSSNQALQAARRLFQAEKAGHTGSLDPLATGVLPVCFGEATKLCGLLLDADKAYWARVRLGSRTSTGDAEGEVIATSDASALTLDDFRAIRSRFLGPIRQIPPMYSALKRNGRPLYELARAGEEVERSPRDVVIHQLEPCALIDGELELTVTCSKGTYIRTLVEDLAGALGHCAHLSSLRRTRVGPFAGGRIWTLEELQEHAAGGFEPLDRLLLPLSAAVVDWPQVQVSQGLLRRLSRGQSIECRPPEVPLDAAIAVMDEEGILRAVGRVGPDGLLWPRRWVGGAIPA
jgi:tRNA pseudouridine55 synthase